MKPLLLAACLLAACRPSDGGSQSSRTGATTTATTASGASAPTATNDSAFADRLLARADAGRIQGDTAAPVWIIEVSDFQCPYCKRWHDETYPALRREFIQAGIVRMAYLNLPLGQHEHALAAAQAAMCASAQERFWPVHDALFNTQERWTPLGAAQAVAMFDSIALASDINAQEYRRCRDSNVMQRLIIADKSRATAAGVNSTPSFFVGREGISGAAPIQEFRAAIARARAQAGRPQR